MGLGVQVIEANKIVFSFELCLLLPTETALAGKLLNTVNEMFVKLVSQNYEAWIIQTLFFKIYYILAVSITWGNKFHKYKLNV